MSSLPLFERSAIADPPPDLRPYQKSAIEQIRKAYNEDKRRILLIAPTGAGKMFIIGALTKSSRGKVLFVAHRKELIDQCVKEIQRQGLSHVGVIRGDDEREDPTAPVQVASIQTLARRDKPPADVIFVDEVHRGASDIYREHVFDAYLRALIIGFTATPTRLDGKPLGGDLFQILIVVATYAELIQKKWLSEPDIYGTSMRPNLSSVRTMGGDFAEPDLSRVMNTDRLNGNVVDQWLRLSNLHPVFKDGKRTDGTRVGSRRRTFLFAVDIAHSLALVSRFEAAGVRIAHLDGNTPEKDRDRILHHLSIGKLDIVSNVNVLLEGVDVPSVKCISHARPTQSIVLWRQSAGRGLRPWCEVCNGPCGQHDYVVPILLDHGNSFDIHGPPHEDVAWSLSMRASRLSSSPSYKSCTACQAQVLSGLYTCPHCNFSFPEPERKKVTESPEELARRAADPESARKAFFDKQVQIARLKGFKPGYASAKFKERYNEWPPRAWGEKVKASYASDPFWYEAVERRTRQKDAQKAVDNKLKSEGASTPVDGGAHSRGEDKWEPQAAMPRSGDNPGETGTFDDDREESFADWYEGQR